MVINIVPLLFCFAGARTRTEVVIELRVRARLTRRYITKGIHTRNYLHAY